MAASTRGPLPPGVYWRRRLAVLSLALLVFVGVGKVLSLGSDGSSDDKAEQTGASSLTSPTATVPAPQPTRKGGKGKGHGGKGGKGGQSTATPTLTPTPTPVLPDPTGPCADDDVFLTPTIAAPVGGADITIMLNLQTKVAAACTWHVSPETVTMNIVSGHDKIWLSDQCPDAIPVQDVIVRLASVTQVPVVWSSRRSDDECSDRTAWALPGSYHAIAASRGGEEVDVQFELVAPAAPTVTQTAEPQGSGSGGGSDGGSGNGGGSGGG
jgi:hypothetical protein